MRATKTLFVVDPKLVKVDVLCKYRFGGERRFKRSTLQPFPARRPLSGNGYWSLESVEEEVRK